MILKKLYLQHYRNYEQLELDADAQTNIFVGANAQGKTNLLEAIYVLALTKSHRTHKDKELISWAHKEAKVRGIVEKKYGSSELELYFQPQGKKAKINGLEQKKLSDFIGMLNVVMFAPEDLEIVKGSPGIRRRFMDMEIGQVQPSYIYELNQYQKVLGQKNRLLKQMGQSRDASSESLLDIWNEQLAQFGTKIMQKRQNFINKLQVWAEQIHRGISGQKEQLKIVYEPSFEVHDFSSETVLFNDFMIKLSHVKVQEINRGMSMIGPHRDDLLFFINDREAHIFGSQGQQRTTALSIKLAEIELIKEEVGEYPLLLLDDVLSELDRNRQTQLLETFQDKVQTFITATGIEGIDTKKIRNARMYQVEEGFLQNYKTL